MRCVGRVCECEDTGVHLERPGGLPWACRARAERCSMGNPARRHTWAWSGGGGRRRSGDQEEWPAPPQEVVLPGFRVLPNGVAPAASALTPEPGRVRQGSPLGHSAQSPLWAAPPSLAPPPSCSQDQDSGTRGSGHLSPAGSRHTRSGHPDSCAQHHQGAAHRKQPRSSPRSLDAVALACMLPAPTPPVFPGKMKTHNGLKMEMTPVFQAQAAGTEGWW